MIAAGSSTRPCIGFGAAPLPARVLEPGIGLAVARRTVFRTDDQEDWGRVADRVAAGSISLLGPHAAAATEQAELRNAIATGALLTSGRHLQHGDAGQAERNMELFTNCATAITSFAKFYLLLNGSGVGRTYDDELVAVDWAEAPELLLHLSPSHPDHPRGSGCLLADGARTGVGLEADILCDPALAPSGAIRHAVEDSREGWAKAVEILEAMAFRRERQRTLLLDLSGIRPRGTPIRGMQGRPAPGPLSLLRGLASMQKQVIEAARRRDPAGDVMQPWEQAMLADHLLSVEVQSGGARRAARMATKSWRDPGAVRFVRLAAEGWLWTANHSLMVDREFWRRVARARAGEDLDDAWTRHALAVFEASTRLALATGEPGLLNGDLLEDHRSGSAWRKPVRDDGGDLHSRRYRADQAAGLLGELSRRAARARFPATTNPCGEVVLHVTGGYCVVADFAPLLACPVPFEAMTPGAPDRAAAALWDASVEAALRLGVRFLIRVNLMDALYAREVRRTNRIGIGPTGLHEWAWLRFGLAFRDLLDEAGRAAPFWAALGRLSDLAKAEATAYAAELGLSPPLTVTTVKPAGTTAKLFGLTEGAHLPARRLYLRWVQFRGEREPDGRWRDDSDPLLREYEARGYPVRTLSRVPGMSIVGFPTLPLFLRLGIGDRLVTAPEATPAEHFEWLRLLERHWIGAERGNQVSYTLKLRTDLINLEAFRSLLLAHQPTVRGCAMLPIGPGGAAGHEYLPEEDIDEDRFQEVLARIRDPGLREAVEMTRLACERRPTQP